MITGKEYRDVVFNSGLEQREKSTLMQYRKESKNIIYFMCGLVVVVYVLAILGVY